MSKKNKNDNKILEIKQRHIRSIIDTSASNFDKFNSVIDNFNGLRNISTTDELKIANLALDRLFDDIGGK